MKREAEDPRNMTEGEPRGSAVPGRSESAEKATDKGSGSSVATAAASSRACHRSLHVFTLGSESTSDFPKTISKLLPI